MPKFTNWQLWGLMALSVAALTTLNILGKVDTSVVVSVVLAVLGVGTHINGVNTAIPLAPVATPTATLETTSAPVAAAPAVDKLQVAG